MQVKLFTILQVLLFTLVAFDFHKIRLQIIYSIQQQKTTEMIIEFLQAVKVPALANTTRLEARAK
jgi:hypothetical protein